MKKVNEVSLGAKKTILSWKERQRVKKMKVKKGKLTNEQSSVNEVSAPGQEEWIKANKKRFIKQYGEKRGKEILYAKAWKMAKEETEINELKKSTLASYITKATSQVRKHSSGSAHAERDARDVGRMVRDSKSDRRKKAIKSWIAGSKETEKALDKRSLAHDALARKRERGIETAASKLAKEETEKKKTLKRGDLVTDKKTGKKYDPFKEMDKLLKKEELVNEISKELAGRYLKKTAPGSKDSANIGAEILRAGERSKQPSKLGGVDRKAAAQRLANDPVYKKMTTKWLNRVVGRERADMKVQKEGKEFDYSAHMSLKAGARTQPGHYLTKNGSTLSGPHPSPAHAVRAYKDLPDSSGVKIIHIKEGVFESKEKSKKITDKALSLARAKKNKVNVEPELKVPDSSVRSPVLHGTEGEQTKDQT